MHQVQMVIQNAGFKHLKSKQYIQHISGNKEENSSTSQLTQKIWQNSKLTHIIFKDFQQTRNKRGIYKISIANILLLMKK